MGFFFTPRKPQRFHHNCIYYDERKERLAKIEENAKRELGLLPPKQFSPEDIRGTFAQNTTHLRRHQEKGKKKMSTGLLLVLIGLLFYLWYAITSGII